MDLSPDCRAMAAVGLDAHGKQTIALWSVAKLRSEGKVRPRRPTPGQPSVHTYACMRQLLLREGACCCCRQHVPYRSPGSGAAPPATTTILHVDMESEPAHTVSLCSSLSDLMGRALCQVVLQVELVTKHATEYNIKVLRFSAYQVPFQTQPITVCIGAAGDGGRRMRARTQGFFHALCTPPVGRCACCADANLSESRKGLALPVEHAAFPTR